MDNTYTISEEEALALDTYIRKCRVDQELLERVPNDNQGIVLHSIENCPLCVLNGFQVDEDDACCRCIIGRAAGRNGYCSCMETPFADWDDCYDDEKPEANARRIEANRAMLDWLVDLRERCVIEKARA